MKTLYGLPKKNCELLFSCSSSKLMHHFPVLDQQGANQKCLRRWHAMYCLRPCWEALATTAASKMNLIKKNTTEKALRILLQDLKLQTNFYPVLLILIMDHRCFLLVFMLAVIYQWLCWGRSLLMVTYDVCSHGIYMFQCVCVFDIWFCCFLFQSMHLIS